MNRTTCVGIDRVPSASGVAATRASTWARLKAVSDSSEPGQPRARVSPLQQDRAGGIALRAPCRYRAKQASFVSSSQRDDRSSVDSGAIHRGAHPKIELRTTGSADFSPRRVERVEETFSREAR